MTMIKKLREFSPAALTEEHGQKPHRANIHLAAAFRLPVCLMICIHDQIPALVRVCLSF